MATTKRDYYEVLHIERGVTQDEIKKAYRKLAVQFHPDRNPDNPDAEAKFREATEAYEILSDEQKRARYDRFGHQGVHSDFADAFRSAGGHWDSSNFSEFFSGHSVFDDLGDILGSMFGSGARSRGSGGRFRGSDLRTDVTLTFSEAAHGKAMDIPIKAKVVCEDCDGTGGAPGSKRMRCEECGGTGQIRRSQGFFSIATTCQRCQGTGHTFDKQCTTCKGHGAVVKERTVNVQIPAGVDNHTKVRVPGEGEAGEHGGSPGDLYLYINVEDHDYFYRDGTNVVTELPIPITLASLGGEVSVPNIDGNNVKIKIPAGTPSGKVFRVRDQGIPHVNYGTPGDLLVRVVVEPPKKMNGEQKKLLRQLAESFGEVTPEPRKPFNE